MSLPPLDAVIKTVVRTGKVVIGSRRTLKLVKLGKVKAVIAASNLPRELREDLEYYAKLSEVPVIVFPGTNMELGVVCGKPFSVAMMGVVDPGQVPLEVLLAYASKR
ncbi:MAG: 50S ribosomal protein L30e [Thermoprotei archaeon]|nr:MAG: 50S ribosomal protein L30e [Thermoprotei archaeon]